MQHELGVLFVHHADDATTRNNLAALRKSNPNMPVVPICCWGTPVDGSAVLTRDLCRGWRRLLPSYRGNGLTGAWRRFRYDLDRQWVWRNADLSAYFYVTSPRRRESAKRWVIFEWDMYCNTDLLAYYGPNFGQAVVSTSLQYPGVNDFYFFNPRETRAMPPSLRPHLMATNPWAGMMLEDGALQAIAERVKSLRYCNGFCEVRLATVARSLGIEPAVNANPEAQRTLRAVTDFEMHQITAPGVWHRVKRNGA